MRTLGRTSLLRLPAAIFILLLLTTFAAAQADVPENADLPRFHRVSERLFRGGQPRPGGLRRLAELGINTIINLRGEGRRTRSDEAEARSLGLSYFNVPLPAWGRPDDVRVRRILEIISAPESGPVFVHCKDGVDRTGTIVALFRIGREGWTSRAALAEADRRGMRKVQYWMRDYVEDYGRRLRGSGAEAAAQHQMGDDDLGDRIGAGVRIAERKTFRARKVGARLLRRSPGAISGFLGGIF
ncbi:MAG TPA: sulfur transferase domain-containing protein [Pyrinomonadaceae bacterium]|nr:sulfur transferase domain-containing protein [Pyrinomonadaceae bacterium]